jgi:hypothetical protein
MTKVWSINATQLQLDCTIERGLIWSEIGWFGFFQNFFLKFCTFEANFPGLRPGAGKRTPFPFRVSIYHGGEENDGMTRTGDGVVPVLTSFESGN